VRQAAIRLDAARSLPSIAVAMDAGTGTAGLVTLATLKERAPALAAAIRRWRLYRDARPMTLTVKGDGTDLTIDLPPNVGTRQLLLQLGPLLDKD